MAVDLFANSTPSSAPQGVDLFAGSTGGVDLFGEEPQPSTGPSFLDHLGSVLPANSMGGLAPVNAEPIQRSVTSAIKTVPPMLSNTIAGMQLSGMEEVANAQLAQTGMVHPELMDSIEKTRQIIAFGNEDIRRNTEDGFGHDVVGSVVNSVAMNAPGIAMSVLTRNAGPALAGAGISTYGQKYADAAVPMDESKVGADYTHAHHAAAGNAFAEVGFERLPTKFLMDNVGKMGVGKLVGKYVLLENATEIPTTIAQNLVDWAELNPGMSFEDWAGKTAYDVAVTAVSTPFSAGITGAGAHALNKVGQVSEAKRMLTQDKALVDSLHQTLIAQGILPEGGTGDSQAILQAIVRDLRSHEANPALAAVQASQLNGDSADIPTSALGTLLGNKVTEILNASGKRTGASLVEDAADLGGITPVVQDRREDYILRGFAGNDVDIGERTIRFQTNPKAVGLRFNQLQDLPDGSVTVLGGNLQSTEALFPGMMPELIGEALTQFQKIAGIQMPILVTLEQLDNGQTGSHFTIPLEGGRYAHVINPRELPQAKYEHGGNKTTQLEFLATLSHEFGHALKTEAFLRNVPAEFQAPLQEAIRGFAITPEHIAQLAQTAPEEAALLGRWNELQTAARNGTISGKELIKAWYGPRKLGLSFDREKGTQSIFAWVEREARAIGITRSVDEMTAQDVMNAVKQGQPEYFLAFDEFMAEQFSRAAQDRNYLKGTRIAVWFQNALESLRTFFGSLKDQGFVKPDVTFEKWLDKQTALAKKQKRAKTWGQVTLSKELKARQKAQFQKMQEELAAIREDGELAVESLANDGELDLPEDEEVARPEDVEAQVSAMVDDLLADSIIEEGKKEHKALLGMLKKGQYQEAQDRVWKLRGINWDQGNVTTKLISRLPDKEMLKRVTVESLGKQLDLTKLDVAAVQEILARYPEGNIPREALEVAILKRDIPLTAVASGDFADYGLLDAGIMPARDNGGLDNVTHVWTAPFAVGRENHFSNPNYVAHTRIVDDGHIRLLVELQSDYFQKQSKKDLETKVKNARTQAIARAADVERLNNELILAHSISEQQKKAAALTTAQLREKEADISLQRYERMLAGLPISEQHEKLNASMQRDDWWKRIIKEEIADAARSGKKEFRVADADTIARIEMWPQNGGIPADVLTKLNEKRLEIYKEMGGEQPYIELFTGRFTREGAVNFRQWNFMMDSQAYGPRWLRVSDMNDAMVEAMGELAKPLFSIKPDYGDMQGIYDRYAKVIPKWLQKEYGATHVAMGDQRETIKPGERITTVNEYLLERYENGAWAFSIPEAAKTVVAWDQGNAATPTYPQITADYLAGLTLEEMRAPEMVSQAVDMWRAHGFQSPFFKRWWREGKLVDHWSGEPMPLFHGSGQVVEFFDVLLAKQERAFFFSDNPLNANFYGKQIWRDTTFFKDTMNARKAQTLRAQIETGKRILDDLQAGNDNFGVLASGKTAYDIRVGYMQKRGELTKLQDEAETLPTKAVTTAFYVRMENPFEIDFENQEWVHGAYDAIIRQAQELGHDGVIVRNVYDPSLGTVYMAFNAEQIKDAYRQKGPFEESDRVAWDQGNPKQSALRSLANGIQKLDPATPLRGAMNIWNRTMDALVQLQQRAAVPLSNGQLDLPMQKMLRDLMKGEAFKNTLQQPGEVLVKILQQRSAKEITQIYAFLESEWKSGKSLFDLQGWTAGPEVETRELIWGNLEDGGRDVSAKTGKLVEHWEYAPNAKAMEALRQHGIDTETPRGQEVGQLVLQYKNIILQQMQSLEQVLQRKIAQRHRNNTSIAVQEIEKLYQTMQKIRLNPFFPQGRFGDYSLVVQELKATRRKGERKYKTVRIEYFESAAAMQGELARWHKVANASGGKTKITWHKADDYRGIPLTLPRNLLEQLENTQLFTKDQLEVMSEMMLPVGHEKLALRYNKSNDTTEGGEKDLIRNYANFIWHNANFIWKLDFRSEFTKAINAQNALLRRAQGTMTPEGITLAMELQRNTDMMQRVKEYVLYPPYELQGLRTAATLVFLAYNAKTAMMNIGTMLNSYAAITVEYGELQGHKMFARGLYDASRLFAMSKNTQTQHISQGAIQQKDSAIAWMYNKAVTEGIIDQSYAYFLAGQANGAAALRTLRRGPVGNMGRVAAEVGMYPFRMVEKMNRLATLTMFFEAERSRPGASLESAYAAAIQRTNLLQNAYDAGNKSELFRGKKAILTMFASYTQFMSWNMLGGYSKALSADLSNRDLGKVKHMLGANAYTMKLWFIYMMLGGALAPPFMENLMELLAFIYRKIYGGNLRLEARKFVKDLGGDADLVMHGMLSKVGGMDLSGSFSLGRILPGVDMMNRDYKNYQEWLGSFAEKSAGAFGGFTEDLVKFAVASKELVTGTGRVGEALKELPGAAGAVGKSYDAWVLQKLNSTQGVLTKSGARVVEEPPGSGNFRDLTNWELVGMALGGNPTVLSRSREMNAMEVGEQIYWRTKIDTLLNHRWEAIRTGDQEYLEKANKDIQKFNESLPDGFGNLRINGKVLSDSLKSHRNTVRKQEQGRVPRKLQGVQSGVEAGFAP